VAAANAVRPDRMAVEIADLLATSADASTQEAVSGRQLLAVVAGLRFRIGHDDEGMAVGREVLRYLSLVQTTSRLLVKADKREMPPPRITL